MSWNFSNNFDPSGFHKIPWKLVPWIEIFASSLFGQVCFHECPSDLARQTHNSIYSSSYQSPLLTQLKKHIVLSILVLLIPHLNLSLKPTDDIQDAFAIVLVWLRPMWGAFVKKNILSDLVRLPVTYLFVWMQKKYVLLSA